MATLPNKGQVGQNLKGWVVDAVNRLIDYLAASRVRPGPGISVEETPSGVVVSLAKPKPGVPQVAAAGGGGGTSYGLSASVSGSTASFALVPNGSLSAFNLIAGSSVTLSAGTNPNEVVVSSTGGSGGGFSSAVYMNTGVVLLSASSYNYVYCPQAYTSGGDVTNQYDFSQSASRAVAIAAIESALGHSIPSTSGYDDDYGNTIFVLPESPVHLTSVEINMAPVSGRAVVVTPDARRIVDSYGEPQGTGPGVCTDQLIGSYNILYVFISSLTGWPQYVDNDDTNKSVIQQCITNDGGCWAKIIL